VLHGAVGAHSQGAVISSADLIGVDIQRLLELGAIGAIAAPVAPESDEH